MNHADIDPSLCSGERPLESLDDGFSPPPPPQQQQEAEAPRPDAGQDIALGSKSPF